MENNTIQSVRGLSSILEGLKPGAPLVRVIGVGEEKALWTGTVLVRDVGEFALLYNIGEGTIDYARLDADQGWRIDGSADGSVPSESVGELVSLLGSKVLGSQRSLILRQKAEVDLNNFKSTSSRPRRSWTKSFRLRRSPKRQTPAQTACCGFSKPGTSSPRSAPSRCPSRAMCGSDCAAT